LDDWNKHRSLNLGFIAYDEANEIDEESYMGMSSRVRQVEITAEARSRGYKGHITRRGIWGATNPNGHDWLWRYFHSESPNRVKGTAFFTSTTLDNPYLPPEYIEKLLQYPKPWVQRYVLCQFDDFAGRIYEDWGWDTHTIPHPNWDELGVRQPIVWMGMDPGTENPTAGLWCWVDQENRRLVGIAEYEKPGVAVDVHAAAWRQIEAMQKMLVRFRVGDPNSITQRDRGTVLSLQTQYMKLGFNFQLGASRPEDRIPALGRLIHLRRFVVSRQTCPKTYEAIKQYQWKDLTPQQRAGGEDPREEPLKKNTHLVECAQYIAGREAPLPKLKAPLHPDAFQDEIHRTLQKNILGKAKRQRSGRVTRHDLGGVRL
jgi:hypothetical protein